MIDAEGLQIPSSGVLNNKLGITDAGALQDAASLYASRRLAELQASPIRGGFDSSHLQEIHRYLYQDVFDWAGQFRGAESSKDAIARVEDSLNRTLDRLSRENLLKGLDANEWVRQATDYADELRALHPFEAGGELAIQEFAAELARKNNLSLEWREEPEIVDAAKAFAEQAERSVQLRRLIMLAVDVEPATAALQPARALDRESEFSLQLFRPDL